MSPLDGGREREITQGEHGMSSHVSGERRAGTGEGGAKISPSFLNWGGHGMSSHAPPNRGRGNIKPLPLTQGRVQVLVATMNGFILSLLSITGGEA